MPSISTIFNTFKNKVCNYSQHSQNTQGYWIPYIFYSYRFYKIFRKYAN